MDVRFVRTKMNLADIYTKPINKAVVKSLLETALGYKPFSAKAIEIDAQTAIGKNKVEGT